MAKVFYCTGDIMAKRRFFKSQTAQDAVSIDNDDVSVSFMLDGKFYCVLAQIPFKNFTVGQYVSYQTVLKNNRPLLTKEIKAILKRVGLNISTNKKLNRLSRIQYRLVNLAARLDLAHKRMYINLDGVFYTAKASALLNKVLKTIKADEINLSVSDSRFITKGANIKCFSPDDSIAIYNNLNQQSVAVNKKKIKRLLRTKGLALKPSEVQKIVCIL